MVTAFICSPWLRSSMFTLARYAVVFLHNKGYFGGLCYFSFPVITEGLPLTVGFLTPTALFPRSLWFSLFPRLPLASCFVTLVTGFMFSRTCHGLQFSRTCHRLHVFLRLSPASHISPPLSLASCFSVLDFIFLAFATSFMFFRALHRPNGFPRLPPASFFPALATGCAFSRACQRLQLQFFPCLSPASLFLALATSFTLFHAYKQFSHIV